MTKMLQFHVYFFLVFLFRFICIFFSPHLFSWILFQLLYLFSFLFSLSSNSFFFSSFIFFVNPLYFCLHSPLPFCLLPTLSLFSFRPFLFLILILICHSVYVWHYVGVCARQTISLLGFHAKTDKGLELEISREERGKLTKEPRESSRQRRAEEDGRIEVAVQGRQSKMNWHSLWLL